MGDLSKNKKIGFFL